MCGLDKLIYARSYTGRHAGAPENTVHTMRMRMQCAHHGADAMCTPRASLHVVADLFRYITLTSKFLDHTAAVCAGTPDCCT